MDIKNVVSAIGETIQVNSVKNSPKQNSSQTVIGQVEDISEKLKTDESNSSAEKLQKPDMDKALSEVNRIFQSEKRRLSFSVNESTRDVIIEVKDIETDEVIRQIPPEYVVKLAEQLLELTEESGESKMASGLLFKYKT